MTKRKTFYKSANINNQTPTESMPDMEYATEYTDENVMKGFNRNSKKGREGKENRGAETE